MITKEAENKKSHLQPFWIANSARSGFSHILSSLFDDKGNKKILMPSYIGETNKEGSGVFDPVRKNEVPFGFYKIKEDLSGDYSDIETKLKSGEFKAILIIHYFGFIQNDLEKIKSLCKYLGVIFIEDCAHAFHSKYKGTIIGDWGDFAFFSIHKTIASSDGGFFKQNNHSIKLKEFDVLSQNIDPITLDMFIRSDYESINQIRINNYNRYLSQFEGIIGVRMMYPTLPEGVIPLNFPVLVDNGLREKLYFKLIEKGVITCALYYRMIEEIDKETFPLSYQIADSIINLPTHQDTTLEEVDYIVKMLKEALAEL